MTAVEERPAVNVIAVGVVGVEFEKRSEGRDGKAEIAVCEGEAGLVVSLVEVICGKDPVVVVPCDVFELTEFRESGWGC